MSEQEAEEVAEIAVEPSGGSIEEITIRRFEKMTDEQIIRLFIFEKFISREYDGHTTVEDMEKVCNWVIDGKIPRNPKGKPQLREVKGELTNE